MESSLHRQTPGDAANAVRQQRAVPAEGALVELEAAHGILDKLCVRFAGRDDMMMWYLRRAQRELDCALGWERRVRAPGGNAACSADRTPTPMEEGGMTKPSDKSDRRECREGWVACRAAWRIWMSKGARKLAERTREKMRWWAAARSQQSGDLRPEPPERFGAAPGWPSLRWTVRRPKRPGWWWVTDEGIWGRWPRIVQVYDGLALGMLVRDPHVENVKMAVEYKWWAGPLPEPPDAPDAQTTAKGPVHRMPTLGQAEMTPHEL